MDYIQATNSVQPNDTKQLLLSLNPPYKALKADSVARVLDEAIQLAGLKDQGFSAKSFRPTGATLAMAAGVLPDTAMQIGRWKTKEVFMNHYVYPRLPKNYTEKILGSQES